MNRRNFIKNSAVLSVLPAITISNLIKAEPKLEHPWYNGFWWGLKFKGEGRSRNKEWVSSNLLSKSIDFQYCGGGILQVQRIYKISSEVGQIPGLYIYKLMPDYTPLWFMVIERFEVRRDEDKKVILSDIPDNPRGSLISDHDICIDDDLSLYFKSHHFSEVMYL